mmetsp:Transcript_457/g.436  ORF Transcript_457/g.436 Transcript_457/m.436 type:complete len:242 (+) Transcript_457:177-902(+)|eukprot:CAMPEP_0184013374 /NCGR_PEP_ID=MMETSP0954-20121128/4978_1 /TAXON_ID=627963 /ORGANISM="Aplanochytrium sp, Strain PBS07" /LENGTH=241 /DNA_ID=CAMNT_0026293557 /DNA_START=66 /DNA_END=791 /DNA_ORIENTATION=+
MATPRLTVFAAATMNGWKPLIALEELGIPYKLHAIDFSKNEQHSPDFLKLNPNGKIPAIVDHERNNFALGESAAILKYIAVEIGEGKLWPKDKLKQYEAEQWLYWAASGLSPAFGNAMFFQRIAAPKGIKDEYATKRYVNESDRCVSVLEARLKDGRKWIMGDDEGFTIVDIMAWTYPATHFWANVDISAQKYPYVREWIDRIRARPAVEKGIALPVPQWHFFGEGDIEAAENANASRFKA